MTGKNVLRQQLRTGETGKPTMSGTFIDSGAADISLEDKETSPAEENDHGSVSTNFENFTKRSASIPAKAIVHEQEIYDTPL